MILILAVPLIMHLPFVEFNNYRFLDHITLTENASPYSLYFNFDKTLVGVFIIALGYNSTKLNVKRLLKLLIINLIVMSILFLGLATLLGYSKLEPKLPTFTFVWILLNLFSTCLAEEAIFRKLIQQHLYESIPGMIADVDLPAFLKFSMVMLTTAFICFITYHYLVRNTFIGKFLNGRRYSRKLKDISADKKVSPQVQTVS
jgi:membrane protease YdiL (CAAX protease family)